MERRTAVVYLHGLREFPVRWLDFGPYPLVCICTVAAAASLFVPAAFLKSHGITIQEIVQRGFRPCEAYSSCRNKVTPLKNIHLSC